MKRMLQVMGGLLFAFAANAGQLDQIKQNAQFVSQRFGPASGLPAFGCNSDSFAYLDSFISRQTDTIKKDDQSVDRFVSLFGSFLGECIVSEYKGTWVVKEKSIHVEVNANGNLNIVQPFHKVAKRIQNGEQDSLLSYYRELLPQAFEPKTNPR